MEIPVTIDRDLEDLIPGYIDNRHKDLVFIQEALHAGDFEKIRIIGHSMKGSGGGYGFETITVIGKGLEEAAKAGQSQEIERLAEELSRYLIDVRITYE